MKMLRKWRAPQFIVMRPSGNTPYNASTGWNREDEQRTNQLLASLSKRFMEGLGLELDRVVGLMHVLMARQGRLQNDEPRVSDVKGPAELEDHKFAKMAIEQARKCVPESDEQPRPRVGAVVVKDGKVLGIGYRGETAPGDHAEYVAMEMKLKDATLTGATVYTTLEPCTTRNHPKIPFAERLIERKVKRVVIGMLDPDDRIRGFGQMKLRTANIITDLFPSDVMSEAEELNREFTRFCIDNKTGAK
ncbi:MAG: ribD 1 [Acidobacteriaceae bacterium]|nr:ribD 1 [Acidobacteriaceae bacterium]